MQSKSSAKLEIFKRDLGERIRKLRTDKGLTQKRFCEKNHLKTPANLSAIEKGKTTPTLDAIINICKNSNISADSLLFGSKIKAMKDDSHKYNDAKKSLKEIINECERLFHSEESGLREEIKHFIEKRDNLLLMFQAMRSGLSKITSQDAGSLAVELRLVKGHIEFLQGELDRLKIRFTEFAKNKEMLLLLFL